MPARKKKTERLKGFKSRIFFIGVICKRRHGSEGVKFPLNTSGEAREANPEGTRVDPAHMYTVYKLCQLNRKVMSAELIGR